MNIRAVFAACLLLGATPAFAQSGGAAIGDAAQSFYTAYAAIEHSGIPDAAARAKLEPSLSPRLTALLDQAAAAEQKFDDQTKGAVPPLLEGDIFTSLFEGATSYKVGACTAGTSEGTCAVSLSYADPQNKPVSWTDTLFLTNTSGGWRVDDIGYGGSWAFGNKGKLSDTLKDAIADAGQ